MSQIKSVELDQTLFDNLIGKYSSKFDTKPSSTKQLTSFCKEYFNDGINQLTYSQLNPYFNRYKRIHLTNQNEINNTFESDTDEGQINDADIDWNKCWNDYILIYKYQPKTAVQLFHFIRDEMKLKTKYKECRCMFTKLTKNSKNNKSSPIKDGDILTNTENITNDSVSNTENGDEKTEIRMKIFHSTTETSINKIKTVFDEILAEHQKMFKKDPTNEWNFYNFIKEDTKYKIKYTDVKFILNYARKHGWISKTQKGNPDESTPKENKSPKKCAKKTKKAITQDEYNEIITEYKKEFKNPPKNAFQVMNYANEFMNRNYRYGVIRIAWNKFKL